jgi:acyl carrier protein
MDNILKTLQSIHAEYDYSASDDYIKDAMLDSFDIVVLVEKLEDTYAINIDGADITPENFKNLSALASLIKKYADGPKS